MTDLEKELEKALGGKTPNDSIAPLVDTAEELRAAFSADAPEARGAQLLFTHGVGARRRGGLGFRLFVPALALASILLALVVVGRTAPPGGSLYPVRGALQAVGLAEGPIEDVEEALTEAEHDLTRGERILAADPEEAADHALDAIESLNDAEELLPDLDRDERVVYRVRIDDLRMEARDLIARAAVTEERRERREDLLEGDDSGSGSGDDDDSGGSGSGDDSGSGSGDDDSSGSGSGDDDDDSGSGSGDDDNSGSGSGGSRSGENSGSG